MGLGPCVIAKSYSPVAQLVAKTELPRQRPRADVWSYTSAKRKASHIHVWQAQKVKARLHLALWAHVHRISHLHGGYHLLIHAPSGHLTPGSHQQQAGLIKDSGKGAQTTLSKSRCWRELKDSKLSQERFPLAKAMASSSARSDKLATRSKVTFLSALFYVFSHMHVGGHAPCRRLYGFEPPL